MTTYKGALKELVYVRNYPTLPAELKPSIDAAMETFEEAWAVVDQKKNCGIRCDKKECKHCIDWGCDKGSISIDKYGCCRDMET